MFCINKFFNILNRYENTLENILNILHSISLKNIYTKSHFVANYFLPIQSNNSICTAYNPTPKKTNACTMCQAKYYKKATKGYKPPKKQIIHISVRFILCLLITAALILYFVQHLMQPLYEFMSDLDKPRRDARSKQSVESKIDQSQPLSTENMVDEIAKQVPNLPVQFWYRHQSEEMQYNATCAKLPQILDLEFSNSFWQTLRTENATLQLYGAYLDNRAVNAGGPTVRILAMVDGSEPKTDFHCQIWYEDFSEPVLVTASSAISIWLQDWDVFEPGTYQPYFFDCPIPRRYRRHVPQSVSIVLEKCQFATNNLRVVYQNPGVLWKKDFGVCVKGLGFLDQDVSVWLVEWAELLGLLGADEISFYQYQVHPNVSRVLDYYRAKGSVQVLEHSLAGHQPNVPLLRQWYLNSAPDRRKLNELIEYNDCFLRNMYRFEYILLLDVNEVIVPTMLNTWKELLNSMEERNKEKFKMCFYAKNAYFVDNTNRKRKVFDDIPRYMRFLQNVYRLQEFVRPLEGVRSFFRTDRAKFVHSNLPEECYTSKECQCFGIPLVDGFLHHQGLEVGKRAQIVADPIVWKYKDELIANVQGVLQELGYF